MTWVFQNESDEDMVKSHEQSGESIAKHKKDKQIATNTRPRIDDLKLIVIFGEHHNNIRREQESGNCNICRAVQRQSRDCSINNYKLVYRKYCEVQGSRMKLSSEPVIVAARL